MVSILEDTVSSSKMRDLAIKKKSITFVDLFAGCGGISTGFIKAGLIPLYCLDLDADCCATLKSNHCGVRVIRSNLEEPQSNSHWEEVDILIGGTPCQSFSEIGLRQGLLDAKGKSLLLFIK